MRLPSANKHKLTSLYTLKSIWKDKSYVVPTPKYIYYAFFLRKENHGSVFSEILNPMAHKNSSQNLEDSMSSG